MSDLTQPALTQADIEKIIPHRYENMLVDQVAPQSDDKSAEFRVNIGPSDPMGRDLFCIQVPSGLNILPATLMEMVALSALVSVGPQPGLTAFFAAIVNFKQSHPCKAGSPIIGQTHFLSEKAGFAKFSGTVSQDGSDIASGQIMATYQPQDALQNQQTSVEPWPEENCNDLVDKSTFGKHSELVAADHVIFRSDTQITTTYTYPESHPLIKGHFPDFPVMMGIMQWIAVEDAVSLALRQSHVDPGQRYTGNAKIVNKEGGLIAVLKKFTAQVQDHSAPTVVFEALSKLTFRGVVKPNDQLAIQVTDLTPIP